MDQLSYCRHRFPPPIIQHAIWLYLRCFAVGISSTELVAESFTVIGSDGPS
jgi:hypothetical protein